MLPDFEPFDARAVADEYLGYAERLRPFVRDTTAWLHEALAQGKRLLFEGAQGSLLDVDHGSYPYVTSSNSSAAGIAAGSGVPTRHIDRWIGVVKAYTTRVGGGPVPDRAGQRRSASGSAGSAGSTGPSPAGPAGAAGSTPSPSATRRGSAGRPRSRSCCSTS